MRAGKTGKKYRHIDSERLTKMTQAILLTVAQQNPVSFDEVRSAYERLNSLDAVMVAIELAVVTECPFNEAIDVICIKSGVCSVEDASYNLNS